LTSPRSGRHGLFRLRGSESALSVARTTVRADVETTAKTLKAAIDIADTVRRILCAWLWCTLKTTRLGEVRVRGLENRVAAS